MNRTIKKVGGPAFPIVADAGTYADSSHVVVGVSVSKETVPGDEESRLLGLLSEGAELAKLAALWHAFSETGRAGSQPFLLQLARAFLDREAPLLAYDVASAGLKYWPNDLELRRFQGRALAEGGAVE